MYYLKGLLLGLTLQLSVGPVCFTVLHKSISKGFKEAFKMVLGVTIVDGMYIILSFTGMGLLLKIYILKKIILILGAIVLALFGIIYLKNAHKKDLDDQIYSKNRFSDSSSFLYAIGLTATNPLTIIFYSGLFGTLIASGDLSNTPSTIVYSLGVLSATVIFLSFVGILGEVILKRVNNKILKVFDYIVGGVLLLFSIKMIIS
jgi:threonine/homoserine/homoserine lactone efflux protein